MDQNPTEELERLLTNRQQEASSQSAPDIYWNDKSEEIFLQDLFASTILTDDFNVNYSTVDLAIPSQDLTSTQTINIEPSVVSDLPKSINLIQEPLEPQKNEQSSSDLVVFDSMTDFVLNLNTSFNLSEPLDYSQSVENIEPVDFLLKQNNSEILYKPIELGQPSRVASSLIENDSNIFRPERRTESKISDILLPATNQLPSSLVTSKATTNINNLKPRIDCQDDDILFKKPTMIVSSLFQPKAVNSDVLNHEKNKKISPNSKSYKTFKKNKLSNVESVDVFAQFKNLDSPYSDIVEKSNNNNHYNKKTEKTLNDLNYSSPMSIKEQIRDKSHLDFDSLVDTDLSSNETTDSTLFNIPSLSSSPAYSAKATNVCFSTSSSINKLFTLKRSHKRSKLVGNTSSSLLGAAPNLDMSQKLTGKQAKLNGTKKISKKDKKEKKNQKQQQHQSLNRSGINSYCEPLSKKFANESSRLTNDDLLAFKGQKFLSVNNQLCKLNKDEEELHIKELSLLDLASSEDDSSERLANVMNNRLKKIFQPDTQSNDSIPFISISSLDNPVRILNNSADTASQNSNNESTVPPKIVDIKSLSDANNGSGGSHVKNDAGNISNPETSVQSKQSQSNKLKQYWKKSCNDSDSGVSTKSSTDSLSTKKKLKQSKSVVSLPVVKSDSFGCHNSQNKRKKQSNSEQYDCNHIRNSSLNSNSHNYYPDVPSSFNSSSCPVATCSDKYLDPKNNKKLGQPNMETSKSPSLDNDTLQHMKNLDLNQDLSNEAQTSVSLTSEKPLKYIKSIANLNSKTEQDPDCDFKKPQTEINLNINLSSKSSRETLWNMLKAHSTTEEMLNQFGSALHDKLSFWDLVQLKIKHSKKNNELKTIYEITDDYTTLYSNMSTLLEGFVKEHSYEGTSSRSRSSSRNYRKQ